ncbi:putative Zeamatin precursor [Tripterygium wilfordii]|uniref:Putative Zeamatin n=1 Tax=Tripterygium wilfordii TaxID=458696 RepID=A0A7J7CPL6_TRIWF|nr:thaumatin-like protein 1 [Tripterygium wilfordii]KAF5735948.1 putative Zeamatin precursor [Tripterygium wilfordii]
MSLCSYIHDHCCTLFTFILLFNSKGISGATFNFVNKCDYTVWPGIYGSPKLDSTGFELSKGSSRSFQAPTGWSGRFWGRTGCDFDNSGQGVCATGDCASGQLECNGMTAAPPATLAEFTLGSGSQDFYDVSLVDGYNLPMMIDVSGGSGTCASTGCVEDLNRRCPAELKADGGGACKSACGAFGSPEYCCSGAYGSPSTCKPSIYSEMFKSACPRSYSYAYDDATSTFTCTGADYTITFCPNLPTPKSAMDPPPKPTTTTTTDGSGSGSESESGTGFRPVEESELASSWLANLATGESSNSGPLWSVQYSIFVGISLFLCFIHFFIVLFMY